MNEEFSRRQAFSENEYAGGEMRQSTPMKTESFSVCSAHASLPWSFSQEIGCKTIQRNLQNVLKAVSSGA
jgi:hypothetical protein